jgi:hypothetical protein
MLISCLKHFLKQGNMFRVGALQLRAVLRLLFGRKDIDPTLRVKRRRYKILCVAIKITPVTNTNR